MISHEKTLSYGAANVFVSNIVTDQHLLALLAQLIADHGLCSGVPRFDSLVRHILLLVVSYW